MPSHTVGTREEWAAARKKLLEREQEIGRLDEELAKERQELPWVRVDKEYTLDAEEGKKTLPELFDGRSQLLIYHLMFGPSYEAACPGCTGLADHFDAALVHVNNRDVTLMCVSRARSRGCRPTGSGWAGSFPGPRPMPATSASTSTWPSPRSRWQRGSWRRWSRRQTTGSRTGPTTWAPTSPPGWRSHRAGMSSSSRTGSSTTRTRGPRRTDSCCRRTTLNCSTRSRTGGTWTSRFSGMTSIRRAIV